MRVTNPCCLLFSTTGCQGKELSPRWSDNVEYIDMPTRRRTGFGIACSEFRTSLEAIRLEPQRSPENTFPPSTGTTRLNRIPANQGPMS